MKYLTVIVIFIIILTAGNLYGQSYYFKHYQVENGLSNNTVFCSIQDKQGFMWFGTKDGLNRFDGYSFKVFREDADNKKSLGSNYVRTLYKDDDGNIYAGTQKGIYEYNAIAENFSLIQNCNYEVRDMKKDKSGNFWFIDGLTLKFYDKIRKTTRIYENAKYFDATSICITADRTLWVSTSTGLLEKYDMQHDSFKAFDIFLNSPNTSLKWIEKIYAASNSILIGTSNHGVKIFQTRDSSYKDILTYNPDKTEIFARDFLQNSTDEFWIATESGIFIYNDQTGKFVNLRKYYNNPYSISDNAVYTLCKDKEGGIWSGTYFGGINYYPKQYFAFEKFFPDYSAGSISGNAVREICKDKYGSLWIGTEDAGLNKFDPATQTFKNYRPSGAKTDIAYSNIHALLAEDDKLWIGTFEHGLDIMDIQTGKVLKHYAAGTGAHNLKSNFIVTIYEMKDGNIYIGTRLGLYKYNTAKDNFDMIQEVPPGCFVHSLTEDDKGNLWIATIGNGLFYFNPATKASENFTFNPGRNNSISSNSVTTVYQDSKKRIWIGTEGGGLCRLNADYKTFSRYSVKNNFPSNTVFKILEDKKRSLWISTTRGLVCFEPTTGNIKIYSKANGLLTDQFNYNSGFMDSTGKMYFGSVKGLISFNPNTFIDNDFTPRVYITGMQVNNQELVIDSVNSPLDKSISFTDKIDLPYDQSSFSIDFAALTYTAPEMTEYAYKMEGLDKNWTYITNRKIYFTNLSPGNYTFKIKAANNSGKWNENIRQLKIKILPPYWQTTWAYVVYVMTASGFIFWLVKSYDNRQVEKNRRRIELLEHKKEREIHQAKIDFFTNVAHEIRTPLTLIKAPLEKIMKKAADTPELEGHLKTMEKNTNRLVDLADQLLDFRKTETKGFSLSFVRTNITELLEDMYINFKPVAEQKNLQFTIEIPSNDAYAHADVEALNKILSNLFSNAIKYAEKKVHAKLIDKADEEANFVIEIGNDGYIIPPEMRDKIFEPFFRLRETKHQMGSGIGLALSRSLAELHKGTLDMNKTEMCMNIFVLMIPVHPGK